MTDRTVWSVEYRNPGDGSPRTYGTYPTYAEARKACDDLAETWGMLIDFVVNRTDVVDAAEAEATILEDVAAFEAGQER